MKKVLLVCAVAVFAVASLSAAPSKKARLDIAALDGAKITIMIGKSEGGTLSYTKNKYPICIGTAPAGTEWKTASFTFNPEMDGWLIVSLMGEWAKEASDRSWIIFDSISIKGSTIGNGDFRKGLSGWWKSGPTKLAALVDSGKTPGKKAVKVNHDNGLTTKFQVKKDEPVTLTIVYRLAE